MLFMPPNSAGSLIGCGGGDALSPVSVGPKALQNGDTDTEAKKVKLSPSDETAPAGFDAYPAKNNVVNKLGSSNNKCNTGGKNGGVLSDGQNGFMEQICNLDGVKLIQKFCQILLAELTIGSIFVRLKIITIYCSMRTKNIFVFNF